jgi:hypothetical protein
VCADCVVLTEGAATFAVCVRCAEGGGASLRNPWLGLLGWLAMIVLGLVAIAVLIALLR